MTTKTDERIRKAYVDLTDDGKYNKNGKFCRHCGAGIGDARRDGEGTCPECDPPVPPQPTLTGERLHEIAAGYVVTDDWSGLASHLNQFYRAAAPAVEDAPRCLAPFLARGSQVLGIPDAVIDHCSLPKGHAGRHQNANATWGEDATPRTPPRPDEVKRLYIESAKLHGKATKEFWEHFAAALAHPQGED